MPNATIELQPATAALLTEQAQQRGLSLDDYLRNLALRERGSFGLSPEWQEIVEKFRRAMHWIDKHRAEYAGQWVCLEGDTLISHGVDAKRVYAEADAKGVPSPFVEFIEAETLPWGGW
jgi:hypothetical protein